MLIIHRKSIMLMHRPQTPQPGFGSITLLQKFTPHFKILDPRLKICIILIKGEWAHLKLTEPLNLWGCMEILLLYFT